MERAYKEQSTILDPRCEILWWRPTALEDLNQTEPKEDMTKDFNGCETVRLHWEEATQRLILQAVYSSSKIRKNSTANIGGVMHAK